MDRDELIKIGKGVASAVGSNHLTRSQFRKRAEVSWRQVCKHFDDWTEYCTAIGVQPGPWGKANLRRNPALSKDECLANLRRVRGDLETISREYYRQHGKYHPETVSRKCGGWLNAIKEIGSTTHSCYYEATPLSILAADFLKTAVALQRIPSLRQVARRSEHGEYCFSGKFDGYLNFKFLAIQHLLSPSEPMPQPIRELLTEEAEKLTKKTRAKDVAEPRKYEHGQMLGFRGFAHTPTYEQEVVAIFAAVAQELGFEILCVRQEFPDCEARRITPGPRKRYDDCIIEFELRSALSNFSSG